MYTFIKHISIPVLFSFLMVSCSDDDDSGNGPGNNPEETETSVNFDISGELEGTKTGVSNFFVNVGPDGSSFTFENRAPNDGSLFWKLEFVYTGSDTVLVEEGTYTVGNVDELSSGDVDFTAAFIQNVDGELPMTWGLLSEITGTLVIDQAGANSASGTFEISFDDPNDDLDVLVIENGVFDAGVAVAYIE